MKIERTLEIPITIDIKETVKPPSLKFHTRRVRKRSKHNDYFRDYYRKHRNKILRRNKARRERK